jgi:hypothetical protein
VAVLVFRTKQGLKVDPALTTPQTMLQFIPGIFAGKFIEQYLLVCDSTKLPRLSFAHTTTLPQPV